MRLSQKHRTTPRVESSSGEPLVRELPTFPQIRCPLEAVEAHLSLLKRMDESIIELTRRVHDFIVSGQGRTETEICKEFSLSQKEFDTVVVWLIANGDIDLDNRDGQINLKLRWQRFEN